MGNNGLLQRTDQDPPFSPFEPIKGVGNLFLIRGCSKILSSKAAGESKLEACSLESTGDELRPPSLCAPSSGEAAGAPLRISMNRERSWLTFSAAS